MRRDGGPPSPLIRNASRKRYTNFKNKKIKKKNPRMGDLLNPKWRLAVNKQNTLKMGRKKKPGLLRGVRDGG
jgi:hypothetical protein